MYYVLPNSIHLDQEADIKVVIVTCDFSVPKRLRCPNRFVLSAIEELPLISRYSLKCFKYLSDVAALMQTGE